MYKRKYVGLVALIILSVPAVVWSANTEVVETSELQIMFDQDQKDRVDVGPHPKPEQWRKVSANDKTHHAKVLELLQQDKVKTADDFYYAAMIMQHGDSPKDYMLAHILAMAAAQKGNKQAVWLSAASFDRLMMSAKQPQIFGTQYFGSQDEPLEVNQPFDSSLVTDSLRKVFNVPTLKENEERVKMLNRNRTYVVPTF
ncbi:MAG: hypothetical protein SGJ27_29940 [Candidatus Melainabacteria bacterium]|nr:hypothetical protein [Candidatus Melainabacteria bacterium]